MNVGLGWRVFIVFAAVCIGVDRVNPNDAEQRDIKLRVERTKTHDGADRIAQDGNQRRLRRFRQVQGGEVQAFCQTITETRPPKTLNPNPWTLEPPNRKLTVDFPLPKIQFWKPEVHAAVFKCIS